MVKEVVDGESEAMMGARAVTDDELEGREGVSEEGNRTRGGKG